MSRMSVVRLAVMLGFASVAVWGQGPDDAPLQAAVTKALAKKQFQGVTGTVNAGTVKLSGTVGVYADRVEAEKRVTRLAGVSSVDDEVEVEGKTVSDEQLGQTLAKKLEYDRVGFGTTVFNAITVSVQNGVVTLGGEVFGPPDRDSAISLVDDQPGVKGVVDHIQVEPLSPADNRIRLAEQRAIYGNSSLNLYALDRGNPIRILAVNGHVTLVGVVNSQGDKDIAGLAANGVSGVFSVTNDLQVAGSGRDGGRP